MKKTVLIVAVTAVIAVAAGAAWFLVRGSSVEVTWGDDWPDTIRGVGTAVETIEAASRKHPTEAERARAVERARWKAYYFAQLRYAEQLGGLKLDARTTVHDAVLEDRALEAVFSDTVRAAAEVPSESRVENLGSAVRATVVVTAPGERIVSLKEALVRAVATGRITLHGPGRGRATAPSPVAVPAVAGASSGRPVSRTPGGAKEGAVSPKENRAIASGSTHGEPGPSPVSHVSHAPRRRPAARPKPQYTGFLVRLPDSPGNLVAAPDFYDAAGRFLGSAFDLPAPARAGGLPVASAGEQDRIEAIAGRRPMEIGATVTGGNIMLERRLGDGEAERFAEAIRSNRVVLVLGGEKE